MERTRTFWAPGRVNLIGEHTDYSGGLVLPAALDLGVTVEAQAAERIELRSDAFDEVVSIEADGTSADPPEGWGRYVAAVAVELALLGRPAVGLSGSVSSTLPGGAGLSSSAALEVAVGTALCAVADFALEPLALAAACQRAELRAVGVPCGIMDQAASILGVAGAAVLLDCATLAHETVPLPDDLALAIVDSAVRHSHEFSGYADRRRELEEALVILGGRRPADVSPEEAERLGEEAGLDDLHRRRLRHVVTENARVREVVAVLRAGGSDRAALGRIFAAGHASMRDDYEASAPEVDVLVELALDAGAIAARITGGGFGGSIVALVPHERSDAFAAALVPAYRARTGLDARIRVCEPAAGAREL